MKTAQLSKDDVSTIVSLLTSRKIELEMQTRIIYDEALLKSMKDSICLIEVLIAKFVA